MQIENRNITYSEKWLGVLQSVRYYRRLRAEIGFGGTVPVFARRKPGQSPPPASSQGNALRLAHYALRQSKLKRKQEDRLACRGSLMPIISARVFDKLIPASSTHPSPQRGEGRVPIFDCFVFEILAMTGDALRCTLYVLRRALCVLAHCSHAPC